MEKKFFEKSMMAAKIIKSILTAIFDFSKKKSPKMQKED
jgi:hypothetical protein